MQIIRELREKDVERLAFIDKACFPDPWTEEMWRGEFARADARFLVLEQGGTVIGFAVTTVLFEEAELPKIAVLPEKRGQGLGKALLLALFTEAKTLGADKMFLEVRSGNVPARKLYESNGFTVLRTRAKYYPDGEDAVEMKKDL